MNLERDRMSNEEWDRDRMRLTAKEKMMARHEMKCLTEELRRLHMDNHTEESNES